MDEFLKSIAYHEAGHAMVSYELHRGFHRVSIIADEESLGWIVYQQLKSFDPENDRDHRTRVLAERVIMTSLGGPIAQAFYQGINVRKMEVLGSHEDFTSAVKLAALLSYSREEARAYLEWLTIRTETIVQNTVRWAGINALAEKLLEKRELGSRTVRKILAAAMNKAVFEKVEKQIREGGPYGKKRQR